MIEVAVEKRLGDFSLDARFSAPAAGIIALYGPSGSGKTTLVNAIAGLVRPDSGRIVVSGETLYSSADRIDLPPQRRRVGYVFQEARLFPHFSVRGNLNYGARTGEGLALSDVAKLLGLEQLLERRPGDLSGGEEAARRHRPRAAVGATHPADGRTAGLARRGAQGGDHAVHRAAPRRSSTSLSSMSVTIWTRTCASPTRWRLIEAGRVVAVGPVEELTSRLDLRALTGRYDAGSVVRASVAGHDLNFGLTELAFPGGRLRVAKLGLPLGTPVRARIRANDVAIALAKPEQISIRNVLPATVIEVAADAENAQVVDVRLRVGTPERATILWSRVTLRASRELDLGVGRPVFALVKAVALDRSNYIAVAQSDANNSL